MDNLYIFKEKVRSLVPPALLAALATSGMSDTIAFVDTAYPVARWNPPKNSHKFLLPTFSTVALGSKAEMISAQGLPLKALIREVFFVCILWL